MQVGTTSNNARNTPENNQNEGVGIHLEAGTTDNHVDTAIASAGHTTSHDRNKTSIRTSLKTTSRFVEKNHPINQILQEDRPRAARRNVNHYEDDDISLLFIIEPKTFEEAAENKSWVASMKEELDQIQKSGTWELVPRPIDKNVIATKWVFRNKLNEDG